MGKSTGDTINVAFRNKINTLKENGQEGTAISYKCAMTSFEKFGGNEIKFSDVTVDWLNKYEKEMINSGSTFTTIGMYTRSLRTIINEGRKIGLVRESNYPFGKGKYIIKEGETRELVLSVEQIKKFVAYKCDTKAKEKYKDIWLFSFLCNGANILDICKLMYSDINIKNNEISFFRSKTIRTSQKKQKIIAPLLPPMTNIIEKWGNDKNNKNVRIFPFLPLNVTPEEEKRIVGNFINHLNKFVGRISLEIGLPKISSYWCRHSYVTILMKAKVPESYISEAVGHSNKNVTQGYFGRFTKEERLEYNSILLQCFQ